MRYNMMLRSFLIFCAGLLLTPYLPAAGPDADGTVRLHARDAEVIGTVLRYEPQPEKNTLGFWTRLEDQAAWNFSLPTPGRYRVIVHQGCGPGQAGSLVHARAGTTTLPFIVQETSGFQDFKPLPIGEMDLPAGVSRFLLAPQKKLASAVMDVRLVTLEPVAAATAPQISPLPPTAPAPIAPEVKKPTGPARWEAEIVKIEAQLKADRPAPGGVVFAGSSSIRLWDLKQGFPDLPLVNCGFGGSVIADSTHFASRLLIPLKPRLIVFYAGDNDSAKGLGAGRIAADFQTFAETIHTALPECRILFIPIKPSISRAKLLPLQQEANALIEQQCSAAKAGQLQYVDLATPLLGEGGSLRPELYQSDGLHLSEGGYEIWNKILRPYLMQH